MDSLVFIGNVDGVHRGHRVVLADGAAEADARGLAAKVLTFDPHPAKVLGRQAPPLLTNIPRKIELIRRVNPRIDVVVQRFDSDFAALSPDDFAERFLASSLHAKVVVVGTNFKFGKGRSGDFDTLSRLGVRLGFEAKSHALVGDAAGPWSSTRARAAIAQGDLDEAALVLGRPHMVSGTVVKGDQRGRLLGFPTCNLAGVEEALPPFGVYAVLVDEVLGDGSSPKMARVLSKGVANLGVRPTVADPTPVPRVEVHLFDIDRDLYGATLRVHWVERLRGEEKFASLDALKAQIANDAERARSALAAVSPDADAAGAWR